MIMCKDCLNVKCPDRVSGLACLFGVVQIVDTSFNHGLRILIQYTEVYSLCWEIELSA